MPCSKHVSLPVQCIRTRHLPSQSADKTWLSIIVASKYVNNHLELALVWTLYRRLVEPHDLPYLVTADLPPQ